MLQRCRLALRPELPERLMIRVHEHEHVVRADAQNHEDDEEVDELEVGYLEHHAEPEVANEDAQHGHEHGRCGDDHGARVVGGVGPHGHDAQYGPPQVLVTQRLPLVILNSIVRPVYLERAVVRVGDGFGLERAPVEGLLQPKLLLEAVADLDDELVAGLALILAAVRRVRVPLQRHAQEVKRLDVEGLEAGGRELPVEKQLHAGGRGAVSHQGGHAFVHPGLRVDERRARVRVIDGRDCVRGVVAGVAAHRGVIKVRHDGVLGRRGAVGHVGDGGDAEFGEVWVRE
mmetsp:Transcript_3359/g.7857  ORF Transcript_3359/g.7857 Transcript_3359/m.7857 type:complete len:287 (-) Transcript_3359:735-1595(-)